MDKQVLHTIRTRGLLAGGERVVIGLSGGADSMALAHILLSLRETIRLTLLAAHVNHGIRGAESDADEAFVTDWCRKQGLECRVLRCDIPGEAARAGEGLEECGRRVRYAFFAQLAGADGRIATAHTAGDNLETMLFHLARGTGIGGLRGIAPQNGNIIRPLLDVTREQVEAYCDAHHIAYCMDATNRSRDYARNRLRMDAVPVLRTVNPRVEAAALRCADLLRDDADYLEQEARRAYRDCLADGGLSADCLRTLHSALRSRVIARYALDCFGVRLDAMHIRWVAQLLSDGGSVQTAGALQFYLFHGRLFAEKMGDPQENQGKPYKIVSKLIIGYEEFLNFPAKEKNQFDFSLDYDRISGKVTVRTRCAGDTIHPAGRGCTKTLKKLMNETGIKQTQRDQVPVLADEAGILAVGGLCTDERAAVTLGTKRVLLVSVV